MLMLVPGQIEEVAEVLSRPRIAKKDRIAPGDRDAFLQLLSAEAALLPHEPAPGVCRDPDDDYVLVARRREAPTTSSPATTICWP